MTLTLCSGSLLQDPKFTRLVTKLQLSLASLLTVSPSLLAQVAAYTITARLAPHWNKVTISSNRFFGNLLGLSGW